METEEKNKIIRIKESDSLQVIIRVFAWLLLIAGFFSSFFLFEDAPAEAGYTIVGSIIVLFSLLDLAKIIEHLYVMRRITEGKAEAEGYTIKKK